MAGLMWWGGTYGQPPAILLHDCWETSHHASTLRGKPSTVPLLDRGKELLELEHGAKERPRIGQVIRACCMPSGASLHVKSSVRRASYWLKW